MDNQLALIPKELVRQSTDIAELCREIVVASSVVIQDRKYVRVEGWQAIATAHGCVASARDVHPVDGGMVATGEIRRMQDGQLIATAEGFVGVDEPTWYGGETEVWDRKTRKRVPRTLPKRPEYAIRAMAQTRAISRACRGCFAHVVVLMNAGLSTTPAEEVPYGGFVDTFAEESKPAEESKSAKPEKPEDPEERRVKGMEHVSKLAAGALPEGADADNWLASYVEHACAFVGRTPPKWTTKIEELTLAELRLIPAQHGKIIEAIKKGLPK